MNRLLLKKRRRTQRPSLPRARRRKASSSGGRRKLLWVLYLLVGAFLVYFPLRNLIFFPLRDQVASIMIKVSTAQSGVVEKLYRGEAVILRQETVLVAPLPGRTHLLAKEGELIRVGRPVLEVVNEDSRRAAQAEVAEIDEEIKAFEAGPGRQLEELYGRRGKTEKEVLTSFTELKKGLFQSGLSSGGMTPLKTAAEVFRRAVSSWEEVRAKVADLEKNRDDLLKEKERRNALLKLAVNSLDSPLAGILSYNLDGLEAIFDPERTDLTASRLFTAEPQRRTLEEGQMVKGGEGVAKIMDPGSFTLAIPIPPEEAGLFPRGKSIKVRWPDLLEREVPAQVVLAPSEGKGYDLARLKVDQYVQPLMGLRKARVELVEEAYYGIVLPSGALVRKDQQLGVYVLGRTTIRFSPVNVVGSNGREVAVQGLGEGTQVVINPFWVREGQRAR
ncbi:MAG: hypothetical protein M1299_13455 [Firmicutes bacterium]|nr:hypothetical protein [Bacillota bacterium]MCL5040795.1 hypothetical protein [Bacillota bacterium]